MQNIDDLPDEYTRPMERTKPWGTCHALLACRGAVNCPFAVINADDYYGATSFVKIMKFLRGLPNNSAAHYCMAGFKLKNTLSPFGGVTRGICEVDENDYIKHVTETRGIVCEEDGSIMCNGIRLDGDAVVSMNMWGCTPEIIETIHERFIPFLDENIDNLTAEFLLPELMDQLLQEGAVSIRQLVTHEKWFGVTYKQDIPHVKEALRHLAEK